MKRFIGLAPFFLCILLLSCSKDDDPIVKMPAPSYLNNPNERDVVCKGEYPFLKWKNDECNNTLLQFRTSQDAFGVIEESQAPENFDRSFVPSKIGLEELKISGSGQIDAISLSKLEEYLRTIHSGKIAIIDLRSESHGFLNGISVSLTGNRGWGNIGKTTGEILREERDSLHFYYKKEFVISGEHVRVENVTTEEDVCGEMGFIYKRIPALDYTVFPSDAVMNEFISYVQGLPDHTWLHFHCAQGRGRTTLFMVLYDMMRNPDLSLEDIIYRQYLVGGAFLYDELKDYPKEWVSELAHERNLILPIFHQYVRQCQKDNFRWNWSEWKNKVYDFSMRTTEID